MRTDGYAVMPYPEIIRLRMKRILNLAWAKFMKEPEEVLRKFPYLTDNPKGNSGSGLDGPGSSKSDPRKWIFHAKLCDGPWLRRTAREVSPSAVFLVNESLTLLEELRPFIKEFGEALEREFDVGNFVRDLMVGYDECILRLLWYPPGYEPYEIIAKQHIDKGGGTLHLAETCEGVERLTSDRRWVTFPVGDGQAVIFPALRMQHRTKCEVKGLCHRVVALPPAHQRGRASAVFFFNFEGTPYFDKGKFGSLQNQTEGFNYDMPFQELDKFFVQPVEG